MLLKFNQKDYLPHQYRFLQSNKPIVGMVSGLGSGKTFALLRKCLLSMHTKLNKKGKSSGLVLYPTYDLATELFVEPFKELLADKGIPYTYNIAKKLGMLGNPMRAQGIVRV